MVRQDAVESVGGIAVARTYLEKGILIAIRPLRSWIC